MKKLLILLVIMFGVTGGGNNKEVTNNNVNKISNIENDVDDVITNEETLDVVNLIDNINDAESGENNILDEIDEKSIYKLSDGYFYNENEFSDIEYNLLLNNEYIGNGKKSIMLGENEYQISIKKAKEEKSSGGYIDKLTLYINETENEILPSEWRKLL